MVLFLLALASGCTHTSAPQSLPAAVATEDHDAALPQNRAVEAKLDQRISFAQFDAIPLDKILQQWSLTADIRLVIDWGALKTAGVLFTTPVTVRLRNTRLSKALQLILTNVPTQGYENHLATLIDDGRLLITTNRELKKISVTRGYDISDLLAGLSDKPSISTDGNAISPLAAREDDIRKYLNDNIESLSWDDNVDTMSWQEPDGSTHCQLMITQTPQTQQRIRRMLSLLRASFSG